MKYVLTPLAKRVLIVLGLMVAASATDADTQKKIFGLGTTAQLTLNEQIDDIITKVKYIKESQLLIKDINVTIKNEAKQQKGRFLGMLLGTLAASVLRNMLTGKPKLPVEKGEGTIRAGEATNRAGQVF